MMLLGLFFQIDVRNFPVSGNTTTVTVCLVKTDRLKHFLFAWSLKNFEVGTPLYLQLLHMDCSSPKLQHYVS